MFLSTQGCSIFYTAHDQFISSMDAISNNTATLENLADKDYTGRAPASKKFFKRKEAVGGNKTKYYFSKPGLWGGECNYYFLVNDVTGNVVNWGFDYSAGDPKKYCGASG